MRRDAQAVRVGKIERVGGSTPPQAPSVIGDAQRTTMSVEHLYESVDIAGYRCASTRGSDLAQSHRFGNREQPRPRPRREDRHGGPLLSGGAQNDRGRLDELDGQSLSTMRCGRPPRPLVDPDSIRAHRADPGSRLRPSTRAGRINLQQRVCGRCCESDGHGRGTADVRAANHQNSRHGFVSVLDSTRPPCRSSAAAGVRAAVRNSYPNILRAWGALRASRQWGHAGAFARVVRRRRVWRFCGHSGVLGAE